MLHSTTVTYVVTRLEPHAATVLLEEKYKVMVLSASHLVENFLPNALLDVSSATVLHGLLQERGGHAYVFATQGLDLAIPTRRAYLVGGQPWHKVARGEVPLAAAMLPCARSLGGWEPQLRWTAHHGALAVCVPKLRGRHRDQSRERRPLDDGLQLWYSHRVPSRAEAACARVRCEQGAPLTTVCQTRIVPLDAAAAKPRARAVGSPAPNLLFVLLDPMSRAHFGRAMPRTRAVLERRGFGHFGHYAVVGANSGPNQVALYQGGVLGGRNVSAMRDSATWLWDALADAGYITMKSEDGCVANSNMVASIRPRTDHGAPP